MVTLRRGLLVVSLLLAGCPDDFGKGAPGAAGLLAPTDLAGVPNGGSQIRLSWSDKATIETGYRLDMNFGPFTTPFIAGSQVLPADATSFVYPSVPNTTYYFRLVAVTATMESDPATIVVTTPDVPVQPTGVTAFTETSHEITVTWQDVPGETGYVVERSSDGGATWLVAGTLPAIPGGTVTIGSLGLQADTEYAHRVIAVNANGRSTPSESALALTVTDAMQIRVQSTGEDAGMATSCAARPGPSFAVAHFSNSTKNVLASIQNAGVLAAPIVADSGPTGKENVGQSGTAIARDAGGRVHILSQDMVNKALRYSTDESGVWASSTVDAPSPNPVALSIWETAIGARPRLACDPAAGVLHAVYQESFTDGVTSTRYAQKRAGQPWVTLRLMFSSIPPDTTPSLFVEGSGIPDVLVMDTGRRFTHIRIMGLSLAEQVQQQSPQFSVAPKYHSFAIDSAGGLHAAYQDLETHSLKIITKAGPVWETVTIHEAPGTDLGAFCSLAIHPASGRLHVAYYDATHGDLRYARRDPGGAWVLRIIDAVGDVGSNLSMALDPNGVPFIAYRDETNRRLKTAYGAP